ncbi:hypothetical protein [Klebsiella pneumoniae]|nr:hypothetical protein [Klebsiella pneumoniae]
MGLEVGEEGVGVGVGVKREEGEEVIEGMVVLGGYGGGVWVGINL